MDWINLLYVDYRKSKCNPLYRKPSSGQPREIKYWSTHSYIYIPSTEEKLQGLLNSKRQAKNQVTRPKQMSSWMFASSSSSSEDMLQSYELEERKDHNL